MSVVVQPSARGRFTPRELVAAYKDFVGGEPQYVDAETGIKASAYRFAAGVLLVYEESEAGVVVLVHPTTSKEISANFALTRGSRKSDGRHKARMLRSGGSFGIMSTRDSDRWGRGKG
jgi:hypothetical protein